MAGFSANVAPFFLSILFPYLVLGGGFVNGVDEI